MLTLPEPPSRGQGTHRRPSNSNRRIRTRRGALLWCTPAPS